MDASPVFFHTAGYLRVPELFRASQVGMLRAATDRAVGGLTAGGRSGDGRSAGEDEVSGVLPDWRRRVDGAVSADPVFLAVAMSEPMVDVLRPVLGPDIELVTNRHNHVRVYPEVAADRLHRDVLQWSRSILTVLIYLTDCTDTAAATRVVPGSHLWPSTGEPNNGGTWLDQSLYYADLVDQAVTVPARAGDAVLMHGQLYHAGAGASPDGPRIVFTLAYRSTDELEPDEPEQSQKRMSALRWNDETEKNNSSHVRLISGRRVYRGRGAVNNHEQD